MNRNILYLTFSLALMIACCAFQPVGKGQSAEYYIDNFNEQLNKGYKPDLLISQEPQGEEWMEAVDINGNKIYFCQTNMLIANENTDSAFMFINQGIKEFPERLDMRWGKAEAFRMMKDYQNLAQTVKEAIIYGYDHNHQWLWVENEPLENGEDVMLNSLLDYLSNLYYTDNWDCINTICQEILIHKPDYIPALNFLAIQYIGNDNDKAILLLKKIYDLDSKDDVVISNIARCYVLNDNIPEAISWYKKILDLDNPNPDILDYAKDFINQHNL